MGKVVPIRAPKLIDSLVETMCHGHDRDYMLRLCDLIESVLDHQVLTLRELNQAAQPILDALDIEAVTGKMWSRAIVKIREKYGAETLPEGRDSFPAIGWEGHPSGRTGTGQEQPTLNGRSGYDLGGVSGCTAGRMDIEPPG
jgi:hypothetical protein